MSKEHNFISAVVYAEGRTDQTLEFLQTLESCLEEHFLQYEIIIVNALGKYDGSEKLKEWAKEVHKPLTVINMSIGQPHEQCMNAGLDITIGDYIYEFDTVDMTYPKELIYQAYETAMEGNDIVTVCPKEEKATSRLFYSIFNRCSGSAFKLRTDAFRLVSRRALNRAHAMNENLPYRKATYAACGLKSAELNFTSKSGKPTRKSANSADFALDSLFLYTDFGYRFSLGFSILMLCGTLAAGMYTLLTYLFGHPINGWTTTMLALTAGLTGIFAILTMVLKYLSLLLKLIFQKQKYLVESIEKL